jgi:transcription elongation factor Elf1
MDVSRNDMLGELANDAGLERTDFVVQATEQLAKFLDRNRDRISQLGGLTLIDDEPDYLSVAPDCTFRVRSRYEDADTGEWVSDTEIVETASELIELFNPAEIYAAFSDAAREAAGFAAEPTAAGEMLGAAGISPEETVSLDADAGYAGAAEQWAAGREPVLDADDEESAALALYNLALDFQDRSQQSEASLIDQFEEAAARVVEKLGDLIIVDDEDERLVLGGNGRFRAEVLPEDGDGEWRQLKAPDEIVEYYDPTDIFGDLADALAEAFPAIAPDLEDEDDDEAVEDVEDVEDAPDGEAQNPRP